MSRETEIEFEKASSGLKVQEIVTVSTEDIKAYAIALHSGKFKGDLTKYLRRNKTKLPEDAVFIIEDITLAGTKDKVLNLRGIDLSNCMFGRNFKIKNADISGSDFSDPKHYGFGSGFTIEDCVGKKVNFAKRVSESGRAEMTFKNVDFEGSDFSYCDFTSMYHTLENVNFAESSIIDTNFFQFHEEDDIYKPYKAGGKESDPFQDAFVLGVGLQYREAGSPYLVAANVVGDLISRGERSKITAPTSTSSAEDIDMFVLISGAKALSEEKDAAENAKKSMDARNRYARKQIDELLSKHLKPGLLDGGFGFFGSSSARLTDLQKTLSDALAEKIEKDKDFLLTRDLPKLLAKLDKEFEVSDSPLDHGEMKNITDDLKSAGDEEVSIHRKRAVDLAMDIVGSLQKGRTFDQADYIKKVAKYKKEEKGKRVRKTLSKFSRGVKMLQVSEAAKTKIREDLVKFRDEVEKSGVSFNEAPITFVYDQITNTYSFITDTVFYPVKWLELGRFVGKEGGFEEALTKSAAEESLNRQLRLGRTTGTITIAAGTIAGLLSGPLGGFLGYSTASYLLGTAATTAFVAGGATMAANEIGVRALCDKSGCVPGAVGRQLEVLGHCAELIEGRTLTIAAAGAAAATLARSSLGSALSGNSTEALALGSAALIAGGIAVGEVVETGNDVAAMHDRGMKAKTREEAKGIRKEIERDRDDRAIFSKVKNCLLGAAVVTLVAAAIVFSVGTFGLGIPAVAVAGALSTYTAASIGLLSTTVVAGAMYASYDKVLPYINRVKEFVGLRKPITPEEIAIAAIGKSKGITTEPRITSHNPKAEVGFAKRESQRSKEKDQVHSK